MADSQTKRGSKPKDTKSITLASLRKQLQGEYAQTVFDKKYEGSCPCSVGQKYIDGYRVRVETRCWRVAKQMKQGFQDLSVTTKHPAKDEIVRLLIDNLNDQKWYNPYRLLGAKGNDLELKDE